MAFILQFAVIDRLLAMTVVAISKSTHGKMAEYIDHLQEHFEHREFPWRPVTCSSIDICRTVHSYASFATAQRWGLL